jgi:hypothetical protein
MASYFGIPPDTFEFEAEGELNFGGETTPLQVSARILWPAAGFPAVIAPRPNASSDPLD